MYDESDVLDKISGVFALKDNPNPAPEWGYLSNVVFLFRSIRRLFSLRAATGVCNVTTKL